MTRLEEILSRISPVEAKTRAEAQVHLDSLTKPPKSLGVLEDIAARYCVITGESRPKFGPKRICVFAADHGVADQGVSAFPKAVTPQMVLNMLAGGAAINVLARHCHCDVRVVDMGVDFDFSPHPALIDRKIRKGTRSLLEGPAMTGDEAVRAVEAGIEMADKAARERITLLGTGDMGIANTTPSTAMLAAFSGLSAEAITGRGTGIDDEGLARKQRAVEAGLARNAPDPADPLDVLAKVGGFEIGAIAGLCLAGARHRIPVVVDGFISTAGALLASRLAPAARDVMVSAHKSQEIGHEAMLNALGLRPLLDLDFRLGEGTGAVLGMGLVDAGVKILCEMATFADAGVSESGD